jgi:hypothetical protein
MQEQPPIELNYAGEAAATVDHSLDSRLLRVRLPTGYKPKTGTLRLSVRASTAPGLPIRIRANTVIYQENEVVFRAELDIAAIEQKWRTVEAAAKISHAIVISVDTDPPANRPTQTAKCATIATINLTSIRWKWWPLEKSADGSIREGAMEENTPITVDLDGTDRHGFRLQLRREKKQKTGYVRADSDFTHYLAPEEDRVTFKVLAPEKIPWKLDPSENQQQIETTWWAQKLDANASLLNELPIETTIRVRAWPNRSIVRHRSGDRPLTNPDDAGQLATREIPLVLGVAKWKLRLLRPDPRELPALLETERPWEEGFEVEVEIFDDSKADAMRLMKNQEVAWKIRPVGENTFSGVVSTDVQKDATNGTWQTDDKGRVIFKFCPTKNNALFLMPTDGQQFYAEFDVSEKNAAASKTAQRGAGVAGSSDDTSKIPSAENPQDKKPPSFALEWAPKFDVQLFKLPYFTAESRLDPDAIPDRETVKAIPVTLDKEQILIYRKVFRLGGVVTFSPSVPIGGANERSVSKELKDFRLIIGSAPREFVRMEPVAPENSAKKSAEPNDERTSPRKIVVPDSPRAKKSREKPEDLPLNIETLPHRDVVTLLNTIVDVTKTMGGAFTKSSGLAESKKPIPGDMPDFAGLGTEFRLMAIDRFASAAQVDLVVCKPTFFTLKAAAHYLPTCHRSWDVLGDAVQLHRIAYKRTIDNSINFLFDFVFCDEVAEQMNKRFGNIITKLKDKTGIDLGQVRKIKLLHETIQTAALRSVLSGFKRVLEGHVEGLAKKLIQLRGEFSQYAGELAQLQTAITHAENNLNRAVSEFQEHTRNLTSLSKKGRELLEEFRSIAPGQRRAAISSFNDRAQRLIDEALDAKGKWVGTSQVIRAHVAGGTSPDSLQTLLKKKIFLEAKATSLELEVTAAQAQQRHVQKAVYSMQQAEDLSLGTNAPTAAEVGQVVGGAKLAIVKEKMEEALEQLRIEPPSALTKKGSRVLESLDARAESVFAGYKASCERTLEGFRAVATEADGLKQLRAIGDSDTWVSQVPSALNPGDSALDFSTELQDVARLAEQTKDTITSCGEASAAVRRRVERHVDGLSGAWKAQQDMMAENLSDGVKAGKEHIFQFLDETQQNPTEGPPAKKPTGMDEGWFDWAIRKVLDTVDWLASLFKSAFAWACNKVTRLPDLIRFVFWLLMYAVNLVLRLVALLGAKVFELLLAVIDFCRSNYGTITYLQKKAHEAGSECLSITDSAHPGAPAGSALFTFPYSEFQLLERWMNSSKESHDKLRWEEEQMDETLRTGYEDYYPRALGEARGCYHRLCKSLLSLETLKSPPVEDSPDDALDIATASVTKLQSHIAQFLQSFADAAPREKDASFTESFRRLRQKPKWTSVDWDTLADWIGFCFSWVFRLVALLVAFFTWWTGAGVAISAGMWLTAASLGSAVAAVGRLVPSLFCYYCYTTAYPRDVVVLQAAIHASLFLPKDRRFKVTSSADFYND